MTPSKACYDLIKEFEGLELEAYLCPSKIWTIGYGSTFYADGKPVKQGDKITKEQAEALLPNIVTKFAQSVTASLKIPVKQNQFDALVSLCYNIGIGNFRASTLLKLVNKGQFDKAALEFAKWNKSKGKVLTGLVRRREAERVLFVGE